MKWWPFRFASSRCSTCEATEAALVRLKRLDFKAEVDHPMVIDAAFDGAAVKLWAAAAVHWFKDTGGKNYVTMEMTDPRTGEKYELTMQKIGGKTPAEKIGELQNKLVAAGIEA